MTNYEIKTNEQFNSKEVYFDGKPNFEILKGLKALKMRWNPKKSCWYGYASETDIINAITGATNTVQEETKEYTTGTVYSEGYLGAIRTDGVNSHKSLFGADLSKAIREHLKHENIKGVTVSCKSYSGGQSITAKIKLSDNDVVDFEEYFNDFKVPCSSWSHYLDENGNHKDIHGEEFYSLSDEEQARIKKLIAQASLTQAKKGISINQFCIDKYTEYSEDLLKKIHKVNEIIKSYNYDDSNSMVDYFETNFYYTLTTVA